MAVIPTYNRQYSSAPGPLNAPKQSLDLGPLANRKPVDAQIADTAGGLADVMVQYQIKRKEKMNDAWVSERTASLTEQFDNYLYGADGVYKKTGESASGITSKARNDLDKYIDDMVADAPSSDAAYAFRQRATSLRTSLAGNIASYENAQLTNWQIEAKSASVSKQANLVMSGYDLPAETLEEQFNSLVAPEIESLAKLRGVPADELVQKSKAAAYSSVIEQNIASRNIDNAQGLLERWGDDLTPENRTQLTASLDSKSALVRGQLKAEALFSSGTSYKDAMADINSIEHEYERSTARSLYQAYWSAQKQAEQLEYTEGVDKAYQGIDRLAGDLVAQQKFYDDMPDETPIERKIKAQTEAKLSNYKAAKGLQPRTDPSAYDSAIEDILDARVTNEQELRVNYGADITEGDLKNLNTFLGESQKATAQSLQTAFSVAIGGASGPKVDLSTDEKESRGKFLIWAETMLRDTNRAQEPGYIQKLADQYVKEYEIKSMWYPGFGKNVEFGDTLNIENPDEALPKVDDETDQAIRELFKQNPNLQRQWVTEYGDSDLAVRGYYKKLLEKDIGPRSN